MFQETIFDQSWKCCSKFLKWLLLLPMSLSLGLLRLAMVNPTSDTKSRGHYTVRIWKRSLFVITIPPGQGAQMCMYCNYDSSDRWATTQKWYKRKVTMHFLWTMLIVLVNFLVLGVVFVQISIKCHLLKLIFFFSGHLATDPLGLVAKGFFLVPNYSNSWYSISISQKM